MRFSSLYSALLEEELKFSDVFSAASKEEVAERKAKYAEVKVREELDRLKKVKLPDGSWHILGKYEEVHFSDCDLTSLKTLNISKVDGSFYCYGNRLTSLEGAPKEVGMIFNCSENQLTDLKGAPEKIDWSFFCSYNKLTSLEGAPKKLLGSFGCRKNLLTTLEYCPKEVGRDFDCRYNDKQFTEKDVRAVCNVKGPILT